MTSNSLSIWLVNSVCGRQTELLLIGCYNAPACILRCRCLKNLNWKCSELTLLKSFTYGDLHRMFDGSSSAEHKFWSTGTECQDPKLTTFWSFAQQWRISPLLFY